MEEIPTIANPGDGAVPEAFYFGNAQPDWWMGKVLENADARRSTRCPRGAEGVLLRSGRFGPYLEKGEQRVSVPEDIPPDELTPERATELLEAPAGDRVLGTDPASGVPVLLRNGRFGPYVQLGENGDGEKRPTASLFKSMHPDTVTLDQALQLLTLPRMIGHDPTTGEEIIAANGRYGPYVKRGSDSRSLESEELLLTVDLEGALAVLAQPKRRRGQAAVGPFADLGADPATGWNVVVRDGRFGPYVTDGGVNASLRREDSVERITVERARPCWRSAARSWKPRAGEAGQTARGRPAADSRQPTAGPLRPQPAYRGLLL
jgi:DNA topoisomerase-1